MRRTNMKPIAALNAVSVRSVTMQSTYSCNKRRDNSAQRPGKEKLW